MNDALLIKMVELDMQHKKVTDYYIQDEVITDPAVIPVSANEVVYVYYLSHIQRKDFYVELTSGTEVVRYADENMRVQLRGATIDNKTYYNYYESTLISRHWSDVHVKHSAYPKDLYVRLLRVKFIPTIENEKS